MARDIHVVGKVGDVVQTHNEGTFEWRISNFFSLSDKVDDSYHSPLFSFSDSRWFLRLYPSGETKFSSSECLDLFLMREDMGPPKTIEYSLAFKLPDGVFKQNELKYEFFLDSNKFKGWGLLKILSRTTLKDMKPTLMPDDVLTVVCNMRSNVTSTVEGEKKFGISLLNVLESGEDSDLKIKVQGREFPVHRVIIRARSAVFHSMFCHDMLEKRNNVINIDDCDPEDFSDFLIHIYSGSCKNISAKNVFGLYMLADKYDVSELKKACSEHLKKSFSVSCFCDILTLAAKHDEEEMIDCAMEFFCNNSLEIVKTPDWETFLVQNVTLGNKLITKALSK